MTMASLKDLRLKKFISQSDLSKESGVALNTICRLEQGKQNPRFVTIRRLAKALGVEPDSIDFS
jgi:transcriptional regulator with XRE-family HTH domain